MKVLISSPRTGSSFLYEHVENYNLQLPNVKKIGPEEFLDPYQMSHMTLHDKIEFLNNEQFRNVNYTFKHHINYLKTSYDYYENWFKDFYRYDQIIVLKRRNTWEWFMSFLFQDNIGWNHATVMANTYNYNAFVDSVKAHWVNYDYKKTLDQFLTIKSQLDTVEGNIVYYEDLNIPYSRYKKTSTLINYESYFENIEEIREYYEKKTSTTFYS